MRDHSSYSRSAKDFERTLQPEISIHRKMKQNNNNKSFIIHTRSQKPVQIHWQYG